MEISSCMHDCRNAALVDKQDNELMSLQILRHALENEFEHYMGTRKTIQITKILNKTNKDRKYFAKNH